jgi:hypothetical protein
VGACGFRISWGRVPLVPIGPCTDAALVAFGVGEHPEHADVGVVDQVASRINSCLNSGLGFVVGHGDVEVEPVPLGPGLVHLLEPQRRLLSRRVDERPARARFGWIVDERDQRRSSSGYATPVITLDVCIS